MYKHCKILGLIPARGGSQGILDKNIYPINGQPLVAYTIHAAEQSELLDGLFCSTNDDKIAQVVSETGRKICKVIRRPHELSTNTSKSIEAVLHAIHFLQEQGEYYDYVVFLQPTSPLRTKEQIDEAIRYVIDNDLPSCVSISEIPYLPVLMRYADKTNSGVLALSNILDGCGTCRRQDAKKNYYVDGSLYIYKVNILLEHGVNVSLNDSPYGFEISSDTALDINDLKDVALCEYMIVKNKNEL